MKYEKIIKLFKCSDVEDVLLGAGAICLNSEELRSTLKKYFDNGSIHNQNDNEDLSRFKVKNNSLH